MNITDEQWILKELGPNNRPSDIQIEDFLERVGIMIEDAGLDEDTARLQALSCMK